MKHIPILAAVAMLVSAAAQAGPTEDLIAVDKAFAQMSLAKGPHAAFLAYMADDVRLYDGDHPPIVGKSAVAEYYAKNPDAPGEKLEWTPMEAEASADGTLGFTRGTWVYTGKNEIGDEDRITGYYVTEWRRQADGRYKFILDIGGVDKAAQD